MVDQALTNIVVTTQHQSIVDYVIGSPMLLSKVKDFAVNEFDPMFFNIH